MSKHKTKAELLADLEQAQQRIAELESLVAHNIEEHDQMEQAIQEKSKQFQTLFESSPDAIILVEPYGDWRILDCNAAACSMNGYFREELVGQSINIFNLTAGTPEEREQYLEQTRTNGIYRYETLHRRKDGTVFPIEVSNTLITLAGREIMMGIDRDITESKRVEQELRASEEKFSKAFLASPDAVVISDLSSGRYLDVNDSFLRETGYERSEIIGASSLELNVWADSTERMRLVNGLQIQGFIHNLEAQYRRKSGEIRDALVSAEIIELGHGKKHLLAVVRDITERKRTEEAIRQRNAELATLNQIGQTINTLAEPSEILEHVYEGIGLALDNRDLYIALYDEATQYISFPIYTMHGTRLPPIGRILGSGITDYIIRNNVPVLIQTDMEGTLRQRGIAMIGTPARSFVAVPMRVENKVIGVIAHQNYEQENFYDEHHVALLTTIASQAATALENSRLYHAVQKELEERKRAETELHESEKKYRDLINGMNDTVWVIDFDTSILDVNNAATIVLGYTREEFLSMKIQDVDVALTQEQIQNLVNKMPREKVQIFETEHVTKEGRIIPVEVSSSLVSYMGRTVIMSIARNITDRKRAEKNLREKEEHYRALIENAPDGIVLVGLDGRFKYVSPSVEHIFGYSQEEAMQGDPSVFTHPEDLPRVLAELMKLIENPTYIPTLQYRFLHKNGQWRWIESTFSNLVTQPTVEAIIINFRDIHERKIAEEALQKSQALLTEAQRIGHIGHMEWNRDDRILICSDEVYEIFDLPRDTHITRQIITEMIQPDERERLQQLDGQALQQHTDIDYEYSIITRNNKERCIHQMGKITYDEQGLPLRMIVIVQDVTERKQAEEKLRESRSRIEMALEGANAAMWDWNIKTGETVFNNRWAEIVGYTVQELEPVSIQTWIALCHPEDLKISNELLEKHFAGEIEFYECEVRMKHKDGSWVWVTDRGKVMEWDADGNPVRMFGTHLDITERKRNERYTEARLRLAKLSYETMDMETLMRTMLDEAEALTDSQIGFFHFVDDDQNTISLQAWSTNTITTMCTAEGKGRHYPVAQAGVWADGVRDGEPRIYNDYASLPNRRELPQGHAPVTRLISLPIKRNNQTVAALGVGNKLWEYDEHDLDIVKRLAEDAFDIVLRKRAESALRASEEKYRGLLESLDSVIAMLDVNGRFLYINDSGSAVFGSSAKETIGRTMHELFPPLVADHQMSVIQSVVATNQGKVVEELSYAKGQPRWYRTSIQPLHDEQGQVTSVLVNATDIHELKSTQQELEELNRSLEVRVVERTAQVQDLYDNAPVGYHSINSNRQFIAINQTELDMLGYSREELLGQRNSMIFTSESEKTLTENFQRLIDEGRVVDMEVVAKRKNGSTFPVMINAVAVYDEKGRFVTSRSTITDITARKRAEEALRDAIFELERALRVKDEFLANMSHELRTPLNAIIGLSDSLVDQIAGNLNDRQQKYVNTIRESGQHLLTLINDILDLAKIESGQVQLERSIVPVRTVCEASLRMIKQLANRKKLVVSFEMDDPFNSLEADERRLKQMLVNLLTNAVKFTPERGEIGLEVHADTETQQIRFIVWDHGIGIQPEDQPRLFKPFVQINNTLTNPLGGTGLGLALVAQLAHLHQGKVDLESEYGKGSRFILTLPWSKTLMESAPENEIGTSQAEQEAKNALLKTILLVEDTETAIMVIQDYLVFSGYNVVVAHNGREGIEQANHVKPDLILMDVQMPEMDGIECTRLLRSQEEFQATPIIALTAFAMTGDRERFLAAGFSDYISKPVNLKNLRNIIQLYFNDKKDGI